MDELTQTVYETLSALTGIPSATIKTTDHLVDELGMDSIELVQLGNDLEDAIDIEIPDSLLRGDLTVGGLLDVVRQIKEKELA